MGAKTNRPLMLLTLALLASGACRRASQGSSPLESKTSFNIQALTLPNLVRVDWDFKFWYLDETPPGMYNEYTVTSVEAGGQVTAVLPCLTGAGGTGNNQVQATANLWFSGQAQPVQGGGTALFVCQRSLDTPVNIVISIQLPVNAGFGDIDGQVTGVGCSSKVDWKTDAWLAVCGDSSCGDAQAVFLFANACQDINGNAPEYWACGNPADWTILNVLASSQFPVPEGDGQWNFGVAATPIMNFGAADPTLTDASGNLLVYSAVPAPLATLVRTNGQNTGTINATQLDDFAADLVLPAQTAGGPTPHQLLELRNGTSGASATDLVPFGLCNVPVQGTASWAGLYVIDVRLLSSGSATVTFSSQAGGLATQSATCTAQWGTGNTPQLACTAAGPLS